MKMLIHKQINFVYFFFNEAQINNMNGFFLNHLFLFHFILGLNNIKSSRDMDISLMYKILRNSKKLIGSPKSCWGKLPQKTDIEKADDIERIHQYRNLICHKDASEMNTDEFNESTLDLIEVICGNLIIKVARNIIYLHVFNGYKNNRKFNGSQDSRCFTRGSRVGLLHCYMYCPKT